MAQKMKWIAVIVLVVLAILVITPPLYYDYIYPNTSDDTAAHLRYFSNMGDYSALYFGQAVVGRLMNTLPFNMTLSFMWFNYIMLVLLIFIVGITVAYTVNWIAGILAAVLVSFGIPVVLGMFGEGKIFDLINIGIILPVLLLCLHKIDKGVIWKIGACLLAITFFLFHPNGLLIFALLPMVVIYEATRNKMLGRFNGRWGIIWRNRFLVYLFGLSLSAYIGYLFRFSVDPSRLRDDSAILALMFISGVIGGFIIKNRARELVIGSLLVLALSIPNIVVWLGYNSAVARVDKEAFVYLNGIHGGSYIASSEVSANIYDSYTNKQFFNEGWVDYAIVRSIPMTQGCDPLNYWFENEDRLDLRDKLQGYGFTLVKSFDCGEKDSRMGNPVTVDVYERK